MKKILLVLLLLFLIGCEEKIEGMIYLDKKIEIPQGNLEVVLENLPGNIHLDAVKEEGHKLIVNYMTQGDKQILESGYWEGKKHYKDILLFNGGILLAQDKSLEEVMFFLETSAYNYMITVKKDDFEKCFIQLDTLQDYDAYIEIVLSEANQKKYFEMHSDLVLEKEIPC